MSKLHSKYTDAAKFDHSVRGRFDGCAASISFRQGVGKRPDPWRARSSQDGVDPSRVGRWICFPLLSNSTNHGFMFHILIFSALRLSTHGVLAYSLLLAGFSLQQLTGLSAIIVGISHFPFESAALISALQFRFASASIGEVSASLLESFWNVSSLCGVL